MAAAAHNPRFAKKMGIPQKVAKEFNKADAGTPMMHKAMKDMPMAKSDVPLHAFKKGYTNG